MCYNSRNLENYYDDLDYLDSPKSNEEKYLEEKLEIIESNFKVLLNLLYGKGPLQESDLDIALGNISDQLNTKFPEETIQITRKSQALMDLQSYLMAMRK